MVRGVNRLEGEEHAEHGAHQADAQGQCCEEPVEKRFVVPSVPDVFISDVFLTQGPPAVEEKKQAEEAQHDGPSKGALRGGGGRRVRHFRGRRCEACG